MSSRVRCASAHGCVDQTRARSSSRNPNGCTCTVSHLRSPERTTASVNRGGGRAFETLTPTTLRILKVPLQCVKPIMWSVHGKEEMVAQSPRTKPPNRAPDGYICGNGFSTFISCLQNFGFLSLIRVQYRYLEKYCERLSATRHALLQSYICVPQSYRQPLALKEVVPPA